MAAYKVTKTGITLPNVDREEYPQPAAAYGAVAVLDDDGRVVSVELEEDRVFPFAKPGTYRIEAWTCDDRGVAARKAITVQAR